MMKTTYLVVAVMVVVSSACKPITRQEETVSKEKGELALFLSALRSAGRLFASDIIGKKRGVKFWRKGCQR